MRVAYRRGDLIEKRRRLMEDGAAFLVRVEQLGAVMPLRATRS